MSLHLHNSSKFGGQKTLRSGASFGPSHETLPGLTFTSPIPKPNSNGLDEENVNINKSNQTGSHLIATASASQGYRCSSVDDTGTVAPKSASASLRFTPESALNILKKFGLVKSDLKALLSYKEDQLTPENLPVILQEIYDEKNKRVQTEQGHVGKPGPEETGIVSDGLCSSLRKSLDVQSNAGTKINRISPSDDRVEPKQSNQRWDQRNHKPNESKTLQHKPNKSNHWALRWDQRAPSPNRSTITKSITNQSSSDPPETKLVHTNHKNPSKDETPECSSLSKTRPPCDPVLRHPTDACKPASCLPTKAMIQDYAAAPPKRYPHLCHLCNTACTDHKDWLSHQNSNFHLENCKLLRKMFPDWDGDVRQSLRSRSRSPRYDRPTSSRYLTRSARTKDKRSSPPKRSRKSPPRRKNLEERLMKNVSVETLVKNVVKASAVQSLSSESDLEAVVKTLAPTLLTELSKLSPASKDSASEIFTDKPKNPCKRASLPAAENSPKVAKLTTTKKEKQQTKTKGECVVFQKQKKKSEEPPAGSYPPFWVTKATKPFISQTSSASFYIPDYFWIKEINDIEKAAADASKFSTVMLTGLPDDAYAYGDVVKVVGPYFPKHNYQPLTNNLIVLPLQKRAFVYFDNWNMCSAFARDYFRNPVLVRNNPIAIHFVLEDMRPGSNEVLIYRNLMKWRNSPIPQLESLEERLLCVEIFRFSLELIKAVMEAVASIALPVDFVPLANRIFIEMSDSSDVKRVIENSSMSSLLSEELWTSFRYFRRASSLNQINSKPTNGKRSVRPPLIGQTRTTKKAGTYGSVIDLTESDGEVEAGSPTEKDSIPEQSGGEELSGKNESPENREAEETKDGETSTEMESEGVGFSIRIFGFFCKLCSVFYLTEKNGDDLHCRSRAHYDNLQKHYHETVNQRTHSNTAT